MLGVGFLRLAWRRLIPEVSGKFFRTFRCWGIILEWLSVTAGQGCVIWLLSWSWQALCPGSVCLLLDRWGVDRVGNWELGEFASCFNYHLCDLVTIRERRSEEVRLLSREEGVQMTVK